MAKVRCAETECEYCHDCECTAHEINISAGHIHTKHQGYIHHWECQTFKMSKEAEEIFGMLKAYFGSLGERKDGAEDG